MDKTVPRATGRRGGGAHLVLPGGDKERWSVEGKSPEEIARHVDEAVTRARGLEPGTTEYEHAWSEIAAHVDRLSEHAKNEGEKALRGRRKGSERPTVKGAKEVAHVYKERGQETFSVAALANLGTHIAAGAGGLLSAEQAHQFSEQFRGLTESVGGEITLAVIVTFLLSALATAIKRAIEKHRANKIQKARGFDPMYTMLPAGEPATGTQSTIPANLRVS